MVEEIKQKRKQKESELFRVYNSGCAQYILDYTRCNALDFLKSHSCLEFLDMDFVTSQITRFTQDKNDKKWVKISTAVS